MANYERFKELKDLLTGLDGDADKFYNKGNSAAGTRLRKGLQDMKNLAQSIRLEVQDSKNSVPAKK
ncbi:histone H1 [Arcticibacter eurypsychrophilus]|uniref:histone H1 n=1 Tax=Arcticibacter eurypsychrophilus TaxID=1434752 RepID=UPI00084E0877|nr:histone H1 [Arcticibacter eurypsychrophilus]